MDHWRKTSCMEPLSLGKKHGQKRKLDFRDGSSLNGGQKSAKEFPIIRASHGVFMRPIDAATSNSLSIPAAIQLDDSASPKEVRKIISSIQNGMTSRERGSSNQFKTKKSTSCHYTCPNTIFAHQRSIPKDNEKCHDEVIARKKVEEILHHFREYCEHLSEERRDPNEKENIFRRIDFLAAKMVKSNFGCTDKPFLGAVPGVEVGDKFYYRMELHVLGLHRPPQGGIDYMDVGGSKIAISIVASGVYDNDWSDPNTLIYSGQGGNVTGHGEQPEDQKLKGGNLALRNSISAKNPVRVIRGLKGFESWDPELRGATVTYIYDGLYKVVEMWQDRGQHGKLIFKFKLVKMPKPLNRDVEKKSSGKSSVLESIVGRDFLPRGSGIVTRRPLVLQLNKTNPGEQDYAQFLHAGSRKFTDFSMVRKEIEEETDRVTGKTKQISSLPINLSIYSPNVVNLTLVDLPGLTKVAVEGQPESVVQEIENMVRSYVEKPNCIILAVTPANQDLATSDAIKIAREVDPKGERTFGVLTKLDLMDRGTNALDVLEGRSYQLQQPWVAIVNRSQADINRNVDMIAARRREREFFATSPDYGHLANRMGSEYLAKLLSKHLESVIKARVPGIMSLINKNVNELESELAHLGTPVSIDAGAQLYTILDLCHAFDRVFKEHLEGGRPGGDRIYGVFDYQLPAALRKLPLDRLLSLQNVRKVVSEADGYQPHLIAPEQAYRLLIEGALKYFRGPAEASVDAVHFVLKELVRKSIRETQELRRFANLQADIAAASNEALERFRDEGKKTVLRLVDMESSYLTVDFFRKLPQEAEKGGNPNASVADRYTEGHIKRIGSIVFSYVGMVSETLKNTIPKAVVYCQVREAKQSLLDHFYTQLGKKEGRELARLLDEDPLLTERRQQCSRRLELYKSARDEIDSELWAR